MISVVIPARDEEGRIGTTVTAVRAQAPPDGLEVLVVDDASKDGTAAEAEAAGARVVRLAEGGNPGAARNRGARAATGEVVVFLDADCVPAPGWLEAHRSAHAAGATIVGGSLELPRGAPFTARCAHYTGAYHVHPSRPAGPVPNHPPANLSVRRTLLFSAGGFSEQAPVCDGHEELAWQAALRAAGHVLHFEPRAKVRHHYRRGLVHLMRRSYRWGYSALESKHGSPAARWGPFYRRPWLAVLAALPLVPFQLLYTLACWARAGVVEPIALAPVLALGSAAYALGFFVGGARWLTHLPAYAALSPRWR